MAIDDNDCAGPPAEPPAELNDEEWEEARLEFPPMPPRRHREHSVDDLTVRLPLRPIMICVTNILFPNQAAAPQPPQIIPNESATASTGSLIDVDTQSVRTVPSDFMEQDVQTSTQQERIEREHEANRLRDAAKSKKAKAKAKASRADNWLISTIASLNDTQASAVVYGNLAAVVGIGAALGYKAFLMHERGALRWKDLGIGAAVVGVVGVVEGAFSR